MKATPFLSFSCWNNFFYDCQCLKCTVEQRRLHENDVAYRLALIRSHSTCSYNLQSELKVTHEAKSSLPMPRCQEKYYVQLRRYWETNDTRKRIKIALTIYRNFMQNFFIRFWEEGQYKPKTTGVLTLLVCGRMSSLSFVQMTFDWDGWNALSLEEGEGSGAQLALKKACPLLLRLYLLLIY